MIPLFVAIPLGAAFLMPILGRASKKVTDILTNLVTLSLLVLSLIAVLSLNDQTLVYNVGGWLASKGIPVGIYMVLDGLSSLMLLVVNLIAFLVSFYSISYMERFTDKPRFYCLFLLMVAGMNGVILSGDMFNIYVFLEIAAISSYALVAFGTEKDELEAAFKYQVLGTVASCMILLGIAILYSLTGTLNMADIAGIIARGGTNTAVLFVAVLFLVGFGLKAAIMPFHAWLPDAHPSAPAPISAMLSGVLIKSIGVYAILRIFFNVLGIGHSESILYILLILGSISMIGGALLALGQIDIKRMLAYSSISQIGYIILAFGLGTPLGFLGGLFHLFNHATFKSLLFLNSGAIEYSAGTRDLTKMGGLASKMPVTGATGVIGSMSIAGIPPFSGFWSKLIIIIAAVQAGHFIFALLAVLASIITLAYYLKLQNMAFFGKLSGLLNNIKEAPAFMCISMVVLAILSIVMGALLIPSVREIVLDPACDVIINAGNYSKVILGG